MHYAYEANVGRPIPLNLRDEQQEPPASRSPLKPRKMLIAISQYSLDKNRNSPAKSRRVQTVEDDGEVKMR